MAVDACLAGGLVLGVAGAVGSGVAVGAAQPEASPTPTSPADALGDIEITFPSPSAPPISVDPGAIASPAPRPTPSASVPPRESTPVPEVIPEDPAPRRASAAPNRSPRPPASKPAAPQPPAVRPTARPEPSPIKKQSPRGNWQPPALGIGVTNIGAPRLASGARAEVTVLCIPSVACSPQGSSLTITAEAETAVVTWSAPASRGWQAWHADSVYSTS